MTADAGDAVRRANGLALRLLAYLLLAGAVAAGMLALAITRLATTVSDGAGRYVLPGSDGRASIDPAAVTVLFYAATALLIAGLATLLFGNSGLTLATPRAERPSRPLPGRARRPMIIFVAGAVFLATVLGLRWHRVPQSSNEAPASTGSR